MYCLSYGSHDPSVSSLPGTLCPGSLLVPWTYGKELLVFFRDAGLLALQQADECRHGGE